MLAPMEGITNHIFRNLIIENGGLNFVATEFVRITTSRQKIKKFNRHSIPLQIQVMSARPDELAACIEFLKDREVLFDDDWVDLNVGCPSKRVNASGAGAALLLEPQKLIKMAEGIEKSAFGGHYLLRLGLAISQMKISPVILSALSDCSN